jgi:hypothetical protein
MKTATRYRIRHVILSIPNENGWDDDVPFQQIILPPIPPEVPKLGGAT